MNKCFCSLANTNACYNCASSMTGTGERYPAPYVNPTWGESVSRFNEIFGKIQELYKKPSVINSNTFGISVVNNNLFVDSYDEVIAAEQRVCGV